MKTWICCLALMLGFGGLLRAQSQKDTTRKVYTFVERMPVFPGGNQNVNTYISKHLHYPDSSRAAGITGSVVVRFIVNAKGEPEEPTIIRSVNAELDEAALKLIREMPAWTPAAKDGIPVDCYFLLPITFK